MVFFWFDSVLALRWTGDPSHPGSSWDEHTEGISRGLRTKVTLVYILILNISVCYKVIFDAHRPKAELC